MYNKNYKKIIIGALLLIFVFTMSGCAKSTEGLVAQVDGDGITQEEFDSDYEVYKKAYERQYGEGTLSEIGEDGKTRDEVYKLEIIDQLILENIIEKDANVNNIKITEEEIKNGIEQEIALIGGQERFEEYLQNNEMSKEFFERYIGKQLLFNKHREEFIKDYDITEDDAKEYFEANKDDLVIIKASHILVASEEEGKKIIERLNNGEDFAGIALLESMDAVSAEQGGSLGYFPKGIYTMIPEFENAAFSLKQGETSELIKTEVGYHIIYLEDRKDTFEDLKDQIINVLKQEKYLDKIQELRDKSKVKIYNEEKSVK